MKVQDATQVHWEDSSLVTTCMYTTKGGEGKTFGDIRWDG